MTIPELKSMLANMRFARGLMNGLVSVKSHEELLAISAVCSQNKLVEAGRSMRVIVGRISFDKEELEFVLEEDDEDTEYEDDDEDEGRFCWSNALDFYWPESCGHKGATLTAALGCCVGHCAVDIGSVLKTPKDCISLKVDVHLVNPLWPDALTAKGIDVNVDCACSQYELPGLDLRDDATRRTLASEGVLCLLVVHSLESTAESEALHQAAERKAAMAAQEPLCCFSSRNYSHTASSLNALALSMPAYHAFR
jgi:hypothetical protein